MQWVTRARPKVDRIACPWLIRRFVDPEAEFLYVPANEVIAVAERTGAIPYDVPGVELGHHGPECSFDAILKKYQLTDPALLQLARIVRGSRHHRQGPHPGIPGLEAIADGFRRLFDDDHEQLAAQVNCLRRLVRLLSGRFERPVAARLRRLAVNQHGFGAAWTALASSLRTGTVISQPMQASVMLWPYDQRGADRCRSWRPSTRKLSSITPMMPRSPAATCSAIALRDDRLAAVVLAAVAVAGVDHHARRQARVDQSVPSVCWTLLGVVVRAAAAAAQDDVAVGVAARGDDRRPGPAR